MAVPRAAPQLVGLLATHIGPRDQSRVDRLRRLLRSVQGQTRRVPLLVSWSADDTASGSPPSAAIGGSAAERAAALLSEHERLGVVQTLPRWRGRLTQFEHYARLRDVVARQVQAGREPLLLFTDDDDIWHPQRAEEYLAAAQAAPEAAVLHSRVHLSPGLGARLSLSTSAADVTRLLAGGQLRRCVSSEAPSAGVFGTAMGEYFDLAVHWIVFDTFFRWHNERVLRNLFADIRFRTFALKWSKGVHHFLPRQYGDGNGDSVPWMYYYDRTTEPYTCPATEEDNQYITDELPRPERIAGIRQTLDCVLFQLAPVQPPFRITDVQFAQQLVGILVEQTPSTVRMALDRCQLHGVEVVPASTMRP